MIPPFLFSATAGTIGLLMGDWLLVAVSMAAAGVVYVLEDSEKGDK